MSGEGLAAKHSARARILRRMQKLALTTALLLALAGAAFAESFRVTYTAGGLIQRITVQAESSAEARRVVQDLFPGATVTGAHRVR